VRVSGEDVSVGPFVSEMDEEERFREREETKRLLYVALTRARDRLYLGSALKDGGFAIGRGSLAEVLPDTLRALFVRAANEPGDTVDWTAAAGRSYRFAICRDAAAPTAGSVQAAAAAKADVESGTNCRDQFGPLDDSAAVARVRLAPPHTESTPPPPGAWGILTRQLEVASLLGSGEASFDVPFSIADATGARVLRGTFDGVVRQPDGSILVLALESAPVSADHAERLNLHVEAARRLFPGAAVNARTLYWNR
jgi:hypothetical protein